MTRAALVAEEVGDWCKRATVVARSLSLSELLLNEVRDQLLSLDGGELDRAFDFTVHEKLLLEEVRKGSEERVTPWAEKLLDSLIVGQSILKLFLSLERLDGSKQLVDFDDQIVKGRDVGQETFRNDDAAVVLSRFGSLADDITDVVDDILERLVTILGLLRDDDQVR